jgi:hypothetical protein
MEKKFYSFNSQKNGERNVVQKIRKSNLFGGKFACNGKIKDNIRYKTKLQARIL